MKKILFKIKNEKNLRISLQDDLLPSKKKENNFLNLKIKMRLRGKEK